MNLNTLAGRRRAFVEEMGTAVEHLGVPRMAGRILACLLTAPSAEISSEELAASLRASRGSISTMTRLLMQLGLVDRVSRLQNRRDYFRLRSNAWSILMQARLDSVIEFHRALDHGLQAVGSRDAVTRKRVEEVHDLYAFFEQEFRDIMIRWERHRAGHGRREK